MSINDLVLKVNDVLTGSVLIIALVGIGLLFTFKLGFIQIRGFKDGWNRTFGGLFSKKGDAGKDGMSSFQALATAIAAQVGTGNIAGAATAIAVGGPGAIFWMWISAFLGMSTIFAEAVMAQKFKQVGDDGTVTGGPVYYIRAAFKGTLGKVLAGIFAVLIIFALGLWEMPYSLTQLQHLGTLHSEFRRLQWVFCSSCFIICIYRWYETNCKSNRDDRANHGSLLYSRFFDCYLC